MHTTLAAALTLTAHVAAAQASSIEIVATNIQSSPTSLAPGGGGVRYAGFNDLSVSVDGAHVLLEAFTFEFSAGNDDLILDDSILFEEGTTPLPWDPTETWRRGEGRVNRAGELVVTPGGVSATPIGATTLTVR